MDSVAMKIKFRRKVLKIGNSCAITIPEEIVEYHNIQPGDEIILMPDINKYNKKYTALWKEVTGGTDDSKTITE